jgi:GT2 family glycosyltransferase
MASIDTTPEPLTRGEPVPVRRVSVVLLNWCAEAVDDTVACVESLRKSTYPIDDVIVVDNGSPPEVGTQLAARLEGVTLIRTEQNLGFTGGNNRGIEHALAAGSEYVWVLNNDTVVEPDCIGELVAVAESTDNVGAVGAKILYYDHPDRVWFAGGDVSLVRGVGVHRRESELDAHQGGDVEEVGFLTGCCMLLPAEVLRSVGGFEEDFFAYVEDVELSLRLRAAGFRLLYQPRARLHHRVPLTDPAVAPYKIVLRDRNRRRLARRRYRLAERIRFGLFFYPTRIAHALRYLARRDWPRFVAIWRGMTQP